MAPLHRAMRARPGIAPLLLATGQHGAMFDEALAVFGVAPDLKLSVDTNGLAPGECEARLAEALVPVLKTHSPALVLVQGDTTSAVAGARAAAALGVAVGHVEAGLRSHDLQRPWPEEGNRIAIDALSTLLFAPGRDAMRNIAADPAIKGKAYLTGNTGIDAVGIIRRTITPSWSAPGIKRLLVTLHRREVIGEPLHAMCRMLARLADRPDVRIALPVHPNPAVSAIIRGELSEHANITLLAPMPYPEMIARMAEATLILSDSGGIQEEAPALGVPLMILRDVTERPEVVTCGAALLAGTDPATILALGERLLDDPATLGKMARPRFPYGRGQASSRIVTVIENYLLREKVT